MINKKNIIGLIIVLFVLASGCANRTDSTGDVISTADRIYNLDPQRKLIGQNVEDFHFIDIITNKQVQFDEINKDKVVMIQSFSNGCPACVKGIAEYNELYEKYDIEVIYIDISPDDSVEAILETKKEFNGQDWLWANYQGSLLPFYEKYNFKMNDMTMIIDKAGKIAYADSFQVPLSRLQNALNDLGVT